MKLHRLLFLVPVTAGLLLASCIWPRADLEPYDAMGVVPQEFLYTTHGPLNDWLDAPVYVQMTNVPLTRIFEHPALRDLNHHWAVRPEHDHRVTIYRVALTRRQLLWSISHDYKLSMIPVTVPGGQSYIEVRARNS
jgi:hypothetical protein